MIFAEYNFYFFCSCYFETFLFATILLLVGATFFKGKFQTESYNFLYVFNTLVAFICLIDLLFYAGELFIAWYGQNPYEWYAFSNNRAELFSWKWFFTKAYLPLFFGLLFFFRKLRINRMAVLIFLLLMHLNLVEELYYRFSRDYLPSHWSVSGPFDVKVMLYDYLIIATLLVAAYLIAKKKNKLPYPSVFLK